MTRNNLCAVFGRFKVFRRIIDASHLVLSLMIQANLCPVLGLPVFKESSSILKRRCSVVIVMVCGISMYCWWWFVAYSIPIGRCNIMLTVCSIFNIYVLLVLVEDNRTNHWVLFVVKLVCTAIFGNIQCTHNDVIYTQCSISVSIEVQGTYSVQCKPQDQ